MKPNAYSEREFVLIFKVPLKDMNAFFGLRNPNGWWYLLRCVLSLDFPKDSA